MRTKGGGTERLARSRSYPGFSIGILLSVKVILPVNGVFIPPLNEIHRNIGREGGREMTKKRERISPHFFFFIPTPPSDIEWGLKIQRGINNFLSKWNK